MTDAAGATRFLKYPLVPTVNVSDSGFIIGWVLERLLETNAEFRETVAARKITEMSAEDIGDGKGYFSSVYRIVLQFDDSSAAPFTFVIKVPSLRNAKCMLESMTDDEMRKAQTQRMREGIVRAHNGECEFYRLFSRLEGVPLPKVWYTHKVDDDFSHPGLIIMQDLTGTASVGREGAPTNLSMVKNVARHLAAFHHRQLCSKDDALKKLDGVDTLTKDDFWSTFPSLTAGFVAYDPERLQPLVDGIMPLANRRFAEYALLHRHVELGLPTVLCHGDLHGNNMLFYANDDGTASDSVAAFIDWQSVVRGNPMFDLARFVCVSADAEDELTRLFEESHIAPPQALSVEKLTEAYKLATILQALESPYVVTLFAKSDSGAGMDPNRVKADTARLLLRSLLLLEDALVAAKDVAAAFIQSATDTRTS